MTEKEIIKAEIKRRRKEVEGSIAELGNSESGRIGLFAEIELYDSILSFIESMPVKPKFKVGDTVRSSNGTTLTIAGVTDHSYMCGDYSFSFDIQDEFKLVKRPEIEEFEAALAREWKGYNDRGAATVDALEDNTQELAFAKGFYRGVEFEKHNGFAITKDE